MTRKKTKKVVFFGTPEFAVPSLLMCEEHLDLALVITQPDRKKGRGRSLLPPPIKVEAKKIGVRVIQPENIKDTEFLSILEDVKPHFIVTAAYGKILGKKLLKIPSLECLNVHASVLPELRGAAPVNWAILNGCTVSGVSVMKMERGLDKGPVYLSYELPIEKTETAEELTIRLATQGALALKEVLLNFDNMKARPQNHKKATWARALNKKDGNINWNQDVLKIFNHVRGMYSWPLAHTNFKGKILRIHFAEILNSNTHTHYPGTILDSGKEGIDVACNTGVLRIKKLQTPGKKVMNCSDFLNGNKIGMQDILGQ